MSRRFAFTQFKLDYDYKKLGNYSYIIVGLETCPTTGKQHHQGYVEYKSAKDVNSIAKKLDHAHVEKAKGNSTSNIEYCSKEKNIVLQEGEATKGQGARTDLEGMITAIKENPNIKKKDLIELNPGAFARNYRALDIIKDVYEEQRNWVPEVIYIYGKSGVGKTRMAMEAGATKVKFKHGFFDGYNGEETVVFDDVDEWTFFKERNTLLELLDRYPYRINIKGGSRNWAPRKIYITSNFEPSKTFAFSDTGEIDPAVARRISQVICL